MSRLATSTALQRIRAPPGISLGASTSSIGVINAEQHHRRRLLRIAMLRWALGAAGGLAGVNPDWCQL